MSEALLIIAGGVIMVGALLFGLAKSGPQQSLGGAITLAGLIAATAGGFIWMIGL